ncbi:MAG: hypothetical protein ACLFRP_08005 [Puniceicoccaceae bacterium]
MNVAILHYHFDRGGVTRVVDSTLAAFAGSAGFRFGLVSGRPVTGMPAPSALVPALDYTGPGGPASSPDDLHAEVTAAGRSLFEGREPDLWHIHNPALGKNAAMTGLVSRLARDGRALLLHAHDFAEDFRPANHRLREEFRHPGDPVFPFAPRVGHATINRRDRRILVRAGLPEESAFALPNPVPGPDSPPAVRGGSDLILYPVRALARKNIGELLLLAHCHRKELRFESTLPPTNPAYRERFARWKRLAGDLGLPVALGTAETGDDRPFADRMAGCRSVVTTSIAEGFGLAFLEPWLYGRAVAGRDLPEITGEFREAGLVLDGLYDGFPIPSDLLPPGEAARSWRTAIESAYGSFGLEPPRGAVRRIEEEMRTAPATDFALLGEDLQETVLRTLARARRPVEAPVDLTAAPPDSVVAANRAVLRRDFGAEGYAARLRSAYEALASAPAGTLSHLDPARVREGFLDPDRFRPHFVG